MILMKLLETARAAGRWAFDHPKDALILLLALLLAFIGWRLKRERRHSEELAAKIEGLPPNTRQVVTVYRDHIVIKWRDGPTKLEYRDRYLPPEGKVETITKLNAPDHPPEVVIQDRGFTRRLGGGVVYAGEFLPMVDLKWAYWQRYSLTAGITPTYGGFGLSRHLDDFSPFNNLEVVGLGGFDWHGNPRLGLGVRTNF